MLTMRHDVVRSADSKEAIEAVLRSLGRDDHKKMREATLRNVELQEASQGGVYLGVRPTFRMDSRRICRTVSRVIQGLFFDRYELILPEEYVAVSKMYEQFDRYSIRDMGSLSRIHSACFSNGIASVGNTVFEYATAPDDDDPNVTGWVLRFYGSASFVGFTVPLETFLARHEWAAFKLGPMAAAG